MNKMKFQVVEILPKADEKLRVNTLYCRYELPTLRNIIKQNKYKEVKLIGDGDLIWFGKELKSLEMKIVNGKQCFFNRYPRSYVVSNKRRMIDIMRWYNKLFPGEYNFEPLSFSLPDDENNLKRYLTKNPRTVMIAKPSNGSGGEGIFMFDKIEDFPRFVMK